MGRPPKTRWAARRLSGSWPRPVRHRHVRLARPRGAVMVDFTLSLPSIPRPGLRWAARLRTGVAFAGPAFLVSVGYMDPGNWGTDLAAGSRYGYQLLWVLAAANLVALF